MFHHSNYWVNFWYGLYRAQNNGLSQVIFQPTLAYDGPISNLVDIIGVVQDFSISSSISSGLNLLENLPSSLIEAANKESVIHLRVELTKSNLPPSVIGVQLVT